MLLNIFQEIRISKNIIPKTTAQLLYVALNQHLNESKYWLVKSITNHKAVAET